MHGILAVTKLVLGSGQRTCITYTLFFGIHVSRPLTRVSVGVDVPLTTSTDKVTCILVISVSLGWSGCQGLAALSQTGTLMVGRSHFQELRGGANHRAD